MDRPRAQAVYVAEDGLVGHQWEEKLLVLPRLDSPPPQCRGMSGQGGRKGVAGEGEHPYRRKERGMEDRAYSGKLGKGITFEM